MGNRTQLLVCTSEKDDNPSAKEDTCRKTEQSANTTQQAYFLQGYADQSPFIFN